jgi:hypothetical protein
MKRISLLLFLLVTALLLAGSCACSAQSGTDTTADRAALQRADTLLKQMTLDEKLQFIASKYPFISREVRGFGKLPCNRQYGHLGPRCHIVVISGSGGCPVSAHIPRYSARRAFTGSTDAARSAGIALAIIAQQLRSTIVAPRTRGSQPLT